MSKIKNGGLDQYVGGPFEQQHFGTAGVEGVNIINRARSSPMMSEGNHIIGRADLDHPFEANPPLISCLIPLFLTFLPFLSSLSPLHQELSHKVQL